MKNFFDAKEERLEYGPGSIVRACARRGSLENCGISLESLDQCWSHVVHGVGCSRGGPVPERPSSAQRGFTELPCGARVKLTRIGIAIPCSVDVRSSEGRRVKRAVLTESRRTSTNLHPFPDTGLVLRPGQVRR